MRIIALKGEEIGILKNIGLNYFQKDGFEKSRLRAVDLRCVRVLDVLSR